MKTFLGMCALAVLTACTTTSLDVVSRRDVLRMSQVHDATVLSVRPVTVDGTQSGAGALAGGVVGGVAGSSIGHNSGSVVASVLGAVVGSVVGNAMERNGTREDAVEIIVQLRNGERRAIVQAQGNEALNAGEPVILVTTGGRTHVTRAPAVVVPVPTQS